MTGRQNSYGIHSKPRQFTVAQASIHFLRMLEDNLREASSSLLPEEEPEADQYNPADDVLKRRMDKKVDMVKVGVKDKVAAVTQHRATSGILGFLRGILSFKTSFLKQTMRVPLWIKSKVSGLGQEGEDVQEDNDSIKKGWLEFQYS